MFLRIFAMIYMFNRIAGFLNKQTTVKSHFRLYSIISLFCILLSSAPDAKAEYFRHLTLGDGLSQPSVMAIKQDKLGRMWLGTREGINVYDGESLTSYKGWISNTAEGSRVWIGNEVSAIVSDIEGNIFILIDDNLIKYDLLADRFSKISHTGNIRALAENNGEVVYVAGDSIIVKEAHGDIARLAFTIPSVKQLKHLAVDDGNYYLSTATGLHIFDRKTRKHKTVLPGRDIYSSFVARDGSLWISSLNDGIYRLRVGSDEPEPVSKPTVPQGVLGAGQCRNAIEDFYGRIWYGSFSGLFCYDPESGDTRQIMIPANIGGLTHPSVFGMCCDRKGNLWIGTYYGGVNYLSPDNDKFINFNYDGFAPGSLSRTFVKDIVMDRDGNLWFATDGAGVGCLDKDWKILTHLSSHSPNGTLRQNNIRCLAYDKDSHKVFIGTHLGGLSIYDIGKKSVTNLIDNNAARELLGDVIHELKVYDGNLYIASKKGIFLMDTKSGKIHKPGIKMTTTMFDIDSDGNFYCSSLSDRAIYKIAGLTSDNPVISTVSRPDDTIYPTGLCCSDSGLLVTTLGNGMLIFPDYNPEPVAVNTTTSRLPDDYCYAAITGTDNNVYIISGNHVVKMNLADKSVESLTFSDFFPEAHIINECALMSLPDGSILVGSTKGITHLNNSDFGTAESDGEHPSIYFSKLTIHNKEVSPSDGSGILDCILPYASRITLPSGKNTLKIGLGVSDYTTSTGTPEIEYRLDGFDSHWQTTSDNELRYNDLPAGAYTLRARLPGDDKETSIGITVRHPWYGSWWAWIIYCAAAATIGYFIIHKSIDAAKLRSSLNKEKNERAQIEKLNQEKFVFFTNVSHEFQTPLTLIISHIDILMSRYKRHPKLIESLAKVRTHSEQMSHLITQLLEFRKLQQNRQVLRIGLHDANEALRETAVPFSEYAVKRNISFSIIAPEQSTIGAYDPALLKRVLVNILSNAFKYTPDGGKISCSVKSDSSGNVHFEVTDSGRGIAEKDLPYIFDRFYNGSSDELKRYNIDYRSTGIGLAFAKSIIDKHHGTIGVKSREGEGTSFSVVIPGNTGVFAGDSNVIIETVRNISEESDDSTTLQITLSEMQDINGSDTGVQEAEDSDISDKPLLLVVEDNAELRANLTEFFSSYFRIAEAENGEEGLSKTRELAPDVIVSDVMMPKMSGTEMCRTIKADLDLCHIPVILLTALSSSESKLEGLNTNADDYVTKPFESTLLLARIDNLLRMRRILRKQFEKEPVNEVDMSIVNPLDRDLLKRTTEVIEKHIDDIDFDIPLLCREVGVSRSLFFNKFKTLTGMTPNAFILNYRLKHAAALLTAQPHLSVADVADRSGFTTAIYFSRCFRKQFGVSPVNYRKGTAEPETTDVC